MIYVCSYISNPTSGKDNIMNLFDPPKLVKGIYIRFGENPFVLLSLFSCQAIKQNWTQQEIANVLSKVKKGNYMHLIKTLQAHIHK